MSRCIMFLDVTQLIQSDGAVRELDLSLKLDDMSFNGQDIVFETPFALKGVVKNIAGVLYLNLDAEVSFQTQCAACMDNISESLSFKVNEVFSKTETGDDETIVIRSGNIDLDDLVEKAFVGALPINYLCSEDCKGLCPECGCNLNREECSCGEDSIDPRFSALKDFFKN